MASTDLETKHGQPIVEKPLTATQAKNLKEIIENDFAELRARLLKQVDDRKNIRLREIAAKYGDDDVLDEVRKEGVALSNELVNRSQEWMDSIAARGIIAQGGAALSVVWTPYNLQYKGNEQEQQRVTASTQRLNELVRHYVAQLQRTAERKVLLATVTGGIASQLLAEIPGIEEAIAAILTQVGDEAADDVRSLMSDTTGNGNTPSLTA